ncbi:MAG: translesion DNA synthesis-associated protein ImuA [Burkholderiales bacterium]|nr:translesion DNA synthesis-associated protein ImuA [Burkholderiales bacterium]
MSALSETLDDLLRRQRVWRGSRAAQSAVSTRSTGFAPLDRQLPGGGWPSGALIEILAAAEGGGELQLVLPALTALSAAGQRIVWLAPPHLPFAPALAAAGIDLRSLAVVRTPRRREVLWAAEQVLRARACHALLLWCRDLRYAELRRLAVAADASHALVMLFRPQQAAQASSPAALRLALAPGERGLEVRILKCRGPRREGPLHLHVNRPAHALGRSSPAAARPRDAVACPA